MKKHIDKIVQHLPKGLSETGLEEVATLIDEVVEERVSEEVTLLEAKVKAFLRTKLDSLKESARHQLESDSEVMRSHKVLEAVKTIVAAELDSQDADSAVSHYEQQTTELQEENKLLQAKLDEAIRNSSLLKSKMNRSKSELNKLSEALHQEKEKVEMPFKSSESAVIITNETHGYTTLPSAAQDNFFLNEDVIRLSQPVKKSDSL